jgi:hypothetical protein
VAATHNPARSFTKTWIVAGPLIRTAYGSVLVSPTSTDRRRVTAQPHAGRQNCPGRKSDKPQLLARELGAGPRPGQSLRWRRRARPP